jgi:hypothetical protein
MEGFNEICDQSILSLLFSRSSIAFGFKERLHQLINFLFSSRMLMAFLLNNNKLKSNL